jgi:hypothetical protein
VPQGVDEATADIDAGISSVSLDLPSGVEARIESDSGLTSHTIADEFASLGGGVWESEGYEAAKSAGRPVWTITIDSGIGSIDVDTY